MISETNTTPIHLELTGTEVEKLFEATPQLLFEVTENCNYNCLYCGYGKNYIQPKLRPLNTKRYMPWETAKTLIDTFLNIWRKNDHEKRSIRISFYGGEPLLNFPLIEQIVCYIERAKPQYISTQFNITTNGFLLKRHLKFLIEHNFNVSSMKFNGLIISKIAKVFVNLG